MHPNVAGALINSALYLLCVFTMGAATNQVWAWKLALVSMAIAFLSHVAQLVPLPRMISWALVLWSWVFGALAGIALLF